MAISGRFYGVKQGSGEFVCQILNDEERMTIEEENGKSYVSNIDGNFITLTNIFVETPSNTGPSLQRMKDVLMTVNVSAVDLISIIDKDTTIKLKAALSGIIT